MSLYQKKKRRCLNSRRRSREGVIIEEEVKVSLYQKKKCLRRISEGVFVSEEK